MVNRPNYFLNEEVIEKMGPIFVESVDYTVFEDMSEFVPYHTNATRYQLREEKGSKAEK